MAQPGREFVTDELQVSNISQVAGVTTPIILIGINIEQDAPRVKTANQLTTLQDVRNEIASSSVVARILFTTATTSPIVLSNWATTYAALYGNGKFTVQYKIATAPDQIQEVAIFPIRTKDTATNTFQNTVSFDFGAGIFYSGQIIIEYSNVPLP